MGAVQVVFKDEETVQQVLERLDQGEAREAIASTMGYQSHKSLDQFMRRRHFAWDAVQGQYVPTRNHPNYVDNPERFEDPTARARQVVEYLRHGKMRVKDVARVMRFADTQELARFMAQAGYVWNNEIGNYSKPREPVPFPAKAPRTPGAAAHPAAPTGGALGAGVPAATQSPLVPRGAFEQYLPLLQLLDENQSRLTAILEGERLREDQQIPRYILRGIRKAHSFHIVDALHAMVREFSRENNVAMFEVVEASLVEFLHRHAYGEHLRCLLESK